MQRYISLGLALVLGVSVAYAQVKKHFTVTNSAQYDKIELNFSTTAGTCYISPSSESNPVNIYSNRELSHYEHSYKKHIANRIYHIDLKLQNKGDDGNGSISSKVFNASTADDPHTWKIYLSRSKPFDLDLNYGIGDAYVDLSGLEINKLNIKTGSAEVNVGYLSDKPNKTEMESFEAQVDLGTLHVRNLNLAKARHIQANVGFGSLYLDFTNEAFVQSDVKAKVGAGDLVVIISENQTPVLVKVKDSFFCKVKLTENFREIKDGVFVNKAFDPDADNLLTFDVDVSMGSIIFKEK